MEGQELQDAAREAAEELPGSTMGHPFGPEYEVFKVRGKVFMLLTEVPGEPVVVLKTEPEESQALRQAHRDIKPGYHMNKKHWITLEPAEADGEDRIRNGGGGTLDPDLVRELVTESYRLVVAGLPRAERPVDPNTFGKPRQDSA